MRGWEVKVEGCRVGGVYSAGCGRGGGGDQFEPLDALHADPRAFGHHLL